MNENTTKIISTALEGATNEELIDVLRMVSDTCRDRFVKDFRRAYENLVTAGIQVSTDAYVDGEHIEDFSEFYFD